VLHQRVVNDLLDDALDGRQLLRSPVLVQEPELGLHPDVLPFSNIPAVLAPFLLRPDRVLTMPEGQVDHFDESMLELVELA
jgi:hypothetical protein